MENRRSLYDQARQATQQGDKIQAKNLLNQVVDYEPDNEKAWLLLSTVSDDPAEIEKCLRQAMAIMPDNQAAGMRLFIIMGEKEHSRIDPG